MVSVLSVRVQWYRMAFNSRTKDALEQENPLTLLVGAWQTFNPRHEVPADPGFWNGPDLTGGITSWDDMASLRPFLLQCVTVSVQPWRTNHIGFMFSFIHRTVESSCIVVRADKLPIHFCARKLWQ